MPSARRWTRLPASSYEVAGEGPRRAFLDGIAPLDAVHYLTETRARLLFQFARRDEFIQPWDAELAQLATRERAPLVQWYDCDHWMNDEAVGARGDWLLREL